MKEWTTPDSRNTSLTTNLEEEEFVDALGNSGNASMPEQVKRPNPWRKMMMMMKFCETIKIVLPTEQDLVRCTEIHQEHNETQTSKNVIESPAFSWRNRGGVSVSDI